MPKKSKILLLTLRIGSIGLLIFLIIQLGLLANNDIFNIWEVARIFGQLRDLVSYGIYIVLYYIYYGLVMMIGSLFSLFPGFDPNYFMNFSSAAYFNYVGRWFYLPGTQTVSPTISEVSPLLSSLGNQLIGDFYMVIIRVMVGALFFFAIRASLTSKPGDSIKVIALLNGVLMLPMFFEQLNIVINLLGAGTPAWLQTNILDQQVLKPSIYEELSTDIGTFLTSDIFTVAVCSFVYLEMSFQVAYVDKVIKPTLEREERLSAQIERMHENAKEAVERIKSIKEEQRRIKMEARRDVQAMQEEMEDKKRLSLRSFMSQKKTEGAGFSYIEELIEKKKKEKEEERKLRAMRDTQRVARYLDKLFKQDETAKSTLTAESAAPKASKLVYSTALNITLRFFAITLLTWICVQPETTFVDIFNAPDSIAQSVELQTIEAVLSVFIPVLLVIPLSSTIIKITKQNKMKEQLRLEEIKRLGMTEEEYEEMKKKEKELGEKEEVKMARDKDVLAEQQQQQQTA